MRKFLLVIFSALLFVPSVVAAEAEQALNDTVKPVEGIHPYKTVSNLSDDFTHWSLTFEGGINMIDGDFQQPNITIIPRTRVRPSGAFSVTYDFTPVWGLTGMYTYAPYGVMQKETDTWLLKGQMHLMNLLVNFDLIDAWFPNRQKDIFSLYFLGGLGLAVYNCDYTVDGVTATPRGDGKYNMAGAISLGAAAEFNVGRSVGLGIKGLYHIFTTDMIDTRIKGANNDCMEYASLYLRWKIGAKKKNHERNYSNDDIFKERKQNDLDSLLRQPRQKDTLYISSKDTLVMIERLETAPVQVEHHIAADQRFYVYFDNNSARLTEDGLKVIQQAAARLAEDDALCFEIIGYCDNTGSEQHNKALGQRRAERVAKELTRVYKIEDERLLAVSRGRIENVNAAYSPNRRVELRICSREELQQLREKENIPVLKENPTVADPVEQPVSASAEKPEEVVDVTKAVLVPHATLATVTSDSRTTFARLARKYYKNVYCWPYIYAANYKLVKGNPDFLRQGVRVVVPQLSEAEIKAANQQTEAQMVKIIANQK